MQRFVGLEWSAGSRERGSGSRERVGRGCRSESGWSGVLLRRRREAPSGKGQGGKGRRGEGGKEREGEREREGRKGREKAGKEGEGAGEGTGGRGEEGRERLEAGK